MSSQSILQMNKLCLKKLRNRIFTAICFVALVGCGQSPSASSNGTAGSNDTNLQTAGSANEQTGSAPRADARLSMDPVDRDDLFGRNPPVTTRPGPCPWLSDDAAMAMVKSNRTLVRKQVSNTECRWNENAGFEIRVTAEPTATARAVSQRVYNLDNPPELRAEDGPGDNAVMLYDTTWKENKPMLYANSFEQDETLFFLKVTGMTTHEEGMRSAAYEVAKNFPSATKIEPQRFSNEPAFDVCSLWSAEAVKSTLGVEGEAVEISQGGTQCLYEVYVKEPSEIIKVTVVAFEFKEEAFARLANGYDPIENIGAPAKLKSSSDQFGAVDQLAVYLVDGSVEFNVRTDEKRYTNQVKMLAKNLASRTN